MWHVHVTYAPIEKLFARYLSPGAASSLCICLLRKVNALTEISHSKAPISNKALWGHRWAEKKQKLSNWLVSSAYQLAAHAKANIEARQACGGPHTMNSSQQCCLRVAEAEVCLHEPKPQSMD